MSQANAGSSSAACLLLCRAAAARVQGEPWLPAAQLQHPTAKLPSSRGRLTIAGPCGFLPADTVLI